jgi:hypothetical protein
MKKIEYLEMKLIIKEVSKEKTGQLLLSELLGIVLIFFGTYLIVASLVLGWELYIFLIGATIFVMGCLFMRRASKNKNQSETEAIKKLKQFLLEGKSLEEFLELDECKFLFV